jgi:Chalcone isomerase-like
MKRNLLCLLASLTLLLGVASAHGKECKGVSFPDQAQTEGATLTLNGLGLRQATMFKVNVYVAALYVAQPSTDAAALLKSNGPTEIVLQFVRDVDRSDLVKGWQEGFENNAKSQLPALKDRIEAFKALMTDMKTGEQLRFVHKPGAGTQVSVKGAAKGTIAGDDFAQALLAIWLGPNPPNEDLKAGLLGGACG